MSDAEPEDHGALASVLIMARLLIGWACIALGALGLLMGAGELHYVLYQAVLLLGGVALLAFRPMVRRPRPIAYVTGGVVAALGLTISTLPGGSPALCCRLSGYAHPHGFPLAFLAAGHLDPGRAFAGLFFWLLVGLFPLVALTHLWPAPPATRSPERPIAPSSGHAEQRAEVADDENVGGLP